MRSQMESERKSAKSFAMTSSAAILLMLMAALIAPPPLPCPVRTVSVMLDSYRSTVRVYERARTWSSIARFWVAPQASVSAR